MMRVLSGMLHAAECLHQPRDICIERPQDGPV